MSTLLESVGQFTAATISPRKINRIDSFERIEAIPFFIGKAEKNRPFGIGVLYVYIHVVVHNFG